MRVKQYTLTGGGAADAVAFAAAQASTAGTAFTLTGAAAAISPPRELTFTSAADASTVTFTIVGTDRWGSPATDTVVGPNANTVRTKSVWSRIISITPNASDADTVSVGYAQRVVTPWVGLSTNNATDILSKGAVTMETISGAPTASPEQTFERFTQYPADSARSMTATGTLNDTTPVEVQGTAFRAVLTSVAGTAKFTFARPHF